MDGEYIQPQQSFPYYPDITQMGDFSKWRLKIDDLLRDLEHDLKGEKKIAPKRWEKLDGVTPDMNERGVKSIISIVRMFCNKYTTLSNLDNEVIISMCGQLHRDLAQLLFFSSESFALNEDSIAIIINKIMSFIFMSLKKAEGEGERISLAKQEHIVRHYEEEKQKGNFLPNPFGRSEK